MQKTVRMPVSLISKISMAAKAFEEVEDELEDFSSPKTQNFLKKCIRLKRPILPAKP